MAKTKKRDTDTLEQKLWKAADMLRKNIDAAEYKHITLGLIFLKYISDAFEELFEKLQAGEGEYEGADPEDRDEYKAENVFFVPPSARWTYLQSRAKLPDVGKDLDDAMDAIERDNPSLKSVLPKVYGRQNLDATALGGLIDLVSNIALGDAKARSADILGHVFEYFLGEFALAEGKKGGQFYTPRSLVELLVNMLEPYEGRVYDPCCGSGGMFVQSEKFVTEHQGKIDNISIYGQESNLTTWRLAKMNLAIRGIDSTQVKWNNEGSFLNDAHKDLKADFIIANPPFNDGDWSGHLLRNDGRWQYGIPPFTNANSAWIQHFLFHLSPKGIAGFVLADTSLSIMSNEEFNIRKGIIESNLVDCIISLPSHLFSNTQIAACIWFISRKRESSFGKRKKEILFIDASRKGKLIKRKNRILTASETDLIASIYHNWKSEEPNNYSNIRGLCKSVDLKIIASNNFVLSPNRYIEPEEQVVEINISQKKESIENEVSRLSDKISDVTNLIIKDLRADNLLKIGQIRTINIMSKSLKNYSFDLYKATIKKYFLDFNFNTEKKGKIPDGWNEKLFGDLFRERKLKVKELGFCPPVYSLTNGGIQRRDEKFTKKLAKSNSNYKIAFEGDMVFGLSREIPNLDVFDEKQGAFSGAYHIYSPFDIRIGLVVGTLMRLKLMEQTDILKGGAREGRGLDKDKLNSKKFIIPKDQELDKYWGEINL